MLFDMANEMARCAADICGILQAEEHARACAGEMRRFEGGQGPGEEIMGSVDPAVQLAAALDRRGVTVSAGQGRVIVHLGGFEEFTIRASGIRARGYGREWAWRYGSEAGRHPRDDWEGAAEAVGKFLHGLPELTGTALLYRMDHMGWTGEQEIEEKLKCARHENMSPKERLKRDAR
jgi:hypothetical protein